MSIKSNRGATLVELMTSIAIFGIIAAAALGLLLYATNINSDITAEVIETNRVYQALDLIKNRVAESKSVSLLKSIGTDDVIGIVTDPQFNNEELVIYSEKYIVSENILYFVPATEGSQAVTLLEGIVSFDIVSSSDRYATISFTTTEGNDYTITVSCKNG